jgi:hypothetical protein
MSDPNNDPDFYRCDFQGCSGEVSPIGKKDLQGRVIYACKKCEHKTSDELLMRASGKRRLRD